MQISKIVLWPLKKSENKLELVFELGKVNYIIGGPKTGKSSIWPIVDYCLGSSKLRIPIGPIKEKVLWYGVQFIKKDGDFLFVARSNYSITHKSKWMLTYDDSIPDNPYGNTTSEIVKEELREDFESYIEKADSSLRLEIENNPYGKISFRDLLVLSHQVQYSLVNPSTLFLKEKIDSKIKNLIPYILFNSHVKATSYVKTKLRMEWNTLKNEVKELKNHIKKVYVDVYNKGMSDVEERSKWSIMEYIEHLQDVQKEFLHLLDVDPKSLKKRDIEKIKTLGRIQECISYSKLVSRTDEKGDQYIIARDRHIDESSQAKKEQKKISDSIQTLSTLINGYAKEMGLDFLELKPFFDSQDSILKFLDQEGKETSLASLGNIPDFVGYNISTYLAFHKVFHSKNELKFIPSFLFIDQPSQGFSESLVDKEKLNGVYATLDNYVTKLDFQLILLDRAKPDNLSDLKESSVIIDWVTDSDEGLIPNSWL